MIGNSPKSDINPALAAGLHAVFLFHKDTWVLEHATVDAAPEGQHLIELDAFAKLCRYFLSRHSGRYGNSRALDAFTRRYHRLTIFRPHHFAL